MPSILLINVYWLAQDDERYVWIFESCNIQLFNYWHCFILAGTGGGTCVHACLLVISCIVMCVLLTWFVKQIFWSSRRQPTVMRGFFMCDWTPNCMLLFSICCLWFISYSTGDRGADSKHWECLPCCYFDTDVRNQLLHKVCVLYLCCVLWCVLTFLVGQVNQDDGSFHWQTVICNAMHWARLRGLQGSRQSTRMRASLAFGALLAECGASQEA